MGFGEVRCNFGIIVATKGSVNGPLVLRTIFSLSLPLLSHVRVREISCSPTACARRLRAARCKVGVSTAHSKASVLSANPTASGDGADQENTDRRRYEGIDARPINNSQMAQQAHSKDTGAKNCVQLAPIAPLYAFRNRSNLILR